MSGDGITSLTDEQLERLILSFGASRAAYSETGAFTKDEFNKVLEWAQQAVADHTMLRLALDGLAMIDINADGEVMLRDRERTLRLARERTEREAAG